MGEQNPPLQGFHNLSHYSVLNRKGMITLRNVTQTTTLYFILSTENTKRRRRADLAIGTQKGSTWSTVNARPARVSKHLRALRWGLESRNSIRDQSGSCRSASSANRHQSAYPLNQGIPAPCLLNELSSEVTESANEKPDGVLRDRIRSAAVNPMICAIHVSCRDVRWPRTLAQSKREIGIVQTLEHRY